VGGWGLGAGGAGGGGPGGAGGRGGLGDWGNVRMFFTPYPLPFTPKT
jgi:hypothetical protein